MRCHFDEDCRQVSTEGVTGGYRGEDTGEHRGGVTGGLL